MNNKAPKMPEDLADLLAELVNASRRPVDLLLSGLGKRIRRMAHAQMPHDDRLRLYMDSEDLSQDALMDLVRVVDQFRGQTWEAFFSFVRSILDQKKTDLARHYGRQKRQQDAHETLLVDDIANIETATPSVIVSDAEDKARLQSLIKRLPEPLQGTLELRLQGMDYPELAASVGISSVNARQRISRALSLLRDMWIA